MNSINEHLQTAINTLQDWSKTTGLKFSPKKTQGILFTRKTKLNPSPKLYLSNLKIQFTDTIKTLGLIFDKKLSWAPHLKTLKESYIKRLNVIKTLSNNNCVADKDTLLVTYRVLIRSKLDYGSIVHNSTKSSIKKIIDPIFHSALRLATGAYQT